MIRIERNSLTWITLVVTAIHLVLLLGTPLWKHNQRAGKPGTVLMTRTITAPAVGPVTAQAPSEPPPTPPAPEEPATPLVAESPTAQATAAPRPPRPARPRPQAKPRAAPTESTEVATVAPTTPVVGQASSTSHGSSLIESGPGAIAGPINYSAEVQGSSSKLENLVIENTMQQASAQEVPVRMPRPVKIGYVVTGSVNGTAYSGVPGTLDWRHNGQDFEVGWQFFSTIAGHRQRNSRGLVTAQGLAPVTIVDTQGKDRHEQRFDYANRQVIGAADTAPVEFQPGAQDTLSLMIQLAAIAAGRPEALTPGSSIAVTIWDQGQSQTASFTVLGQETVPAIQGNNVQTVHLAYQAGDPAQTSIDAWLAPSLDYMPARWRIRYGEADFQDFLAQRAVELRVPAASSAEPAR